MRRKLFLFNYCREKSILFQRNRYLKKRKLIIHLQVLRWSIFAEKVIEELENMFVSRWFNFEN